MKAVMFSKDDWKHFRSENYNWSFDRKNGTFLRWGKTQEDDPDFSPIGPEIVDIEIASGKCSGSGTDTKDSPCRWCYKSNGGNEVKYMSLETFKKVLSVINQNKQVTQVAFGITDVDACKDMWDIFAHCRENDIVPNVTINGNKMTIDVYNNLKKYCGAVAVSHYNDETCFNAVKELTSRGMKQINIHKMLSLQSYQSCLDLLDKAKDDPRLENLNAIVFLALKPKGRGVNMTQLNDSDKYKQLIDKAFSLGVGIGFDSCSYPMFVQSIKDNPNVKQLVNYSESCESFGLFSAYVNDDGKYFPCSFAENVEGLEGIDLLKVKDFVKEVWFGKQLNKWRKISLTGTKNCKCTFKNGCRPCPLYNITPCLKECYKDEKEMHSM